MAIFSSHRARHLAALLSLFCFAANRPALAQSAPAPSQPSVGQLVNMIMELDTWPELQLDPDNSEGGWSRLLETAMYFQKLDPALARQAMQVFIEKHAADESGLDVITGPTRLLLLLRAMFDVPKDLLVPEEYPPEPWGRGGYCMHGPGPKGADFAWATLAMPLTWTDQGPSFICELDGYKGIAPALLSEEYDYFRQHFKYRTGLKQHLRALREPRPILLGKLVDIWRKRAARPDPELEYEFSPNDGLGYEDVVVNHHYRNFAPIHVAARRGDVKVLKEQLAKGVPVDLRVNNKGGNGWWHDTTPLMWAALEGSADSVKSLLDAGANVNAHNADGVTPLMFAAQAKPTRPDDTHQRMTLLLKAGAAVLARDHDGHTALEHLHSGGPGDGPSEVTRLLLLLAAGLNINASNEEGETPFLNAMEGKSPAVVRALLEAGGDVQSRTRTGWSALTIAAAYNSAAVVQLLVEAHADVNFTETSYGGTVLTWAARSEREPTKKVRILLKAGARANESPEHGSAALVAAAGGTSPELVALLLQAGAKIDTSATPLLAATEVEQFYPSWLGSEYCPAIVTQLIQAGCDVNAATSDGRTALMGAARAGDFENVRLLLQKEASPTPIDHEGRTALIEAAQSKFADGRIVELLIKSGADVHYRDKAGMTALLYAAAESRIPSTVQALLDAGADTELKNQDGKTALDLLRSVQTPRAQRIVRMLENRPSRRHGLRPSSQ